MSDQNATITGQVLGGSTAVAGTIRVLPETGFSQWGFALAMFAVACSGLILLSFISRRVITKFF